MWVKRVVDDILCRSRNVKSIEFAWSSYYIRDTQKLIAIAMTTRVLLGTLVRTLEKGKDPTLILTTAREWLADFPVEDDAYLPETV